MTSPNNVADKEQQRFDNFAKKFEKKPPKNEPIIDSEGNVVNLLDYILKDLDEQYPDVKREVDGN